MRILVVENDVSLANFIRELLEDWGNEVRRCANGKDAIRYLMIKEYDLILMEAILPDIKGEDLISRLKDISPDVRIVTMTEDNSREMESRIRERGILYYMVKPIETENLKSLLEYTSKKTADRK